MLTTLDPPQLYTDPTIALDADLWGVYGDEQEENGNQPEADRAHAISITLHGTRGKLWLVVCPTTVFDESAIRLSFVCCSGGHFDVLHSSRQYRWELTVSVMMIEDFKQRYERREACPVTIFDDPSVFTTRPDVITDYWRTLARLGGYCEPVSAR